MIIDLLDALDVKSCGIMSESSPRDIPTKKPSPTVCKSHNEKTSPEEIVDLTGWERESGEGKIFYRYSMAHQAETVNLSRLNRIKYARLS